VTTCRPNATVQSELFGDIMVSSMISHYLVGEKKKQVRLSESDL